VFAAGSLGARLAGVTLVTGSLAASLIVVPALEVAGTVSVLPANLGVAEGAAAVALHAHGQPMTRAVTTALVLHAVETAGSVVFGGVGAGLLLRRSLDLYGRNGFDVLCVTDHVNRSDDPWLPADAPARGVVRGNHADYLAEIEAQAERAKREYDLLLLPGLELTYNDLDPYLAAHAVAV